MPLNKTSPITTLQNITPSFQLFLDLLGESYKMFNVKICAYCLMDNHYHLLMSTPDANLSRIMRHLNGVYTQKYNRLMKTDGPLYRIFI
jgi:putative transposase